MSSQNRILDEVVGQESMQTTAGQPILRYTEESKPKEESMPNCLNYKTKIFVQEVYNYSPAEHSGLGEKK